MNISKVSKDESIRILLVVNNLGCGGAERQLLRVAQSLRNKVFDVEVAYYDISDETLKPCFEEAGIPLVVLDRNKWGRLAYILKAASLMKKKQYDIVHTFGGSTANFYGRVPASLARIPVILGAVRGKQHFVRWHIAFFNSIANLFSHGWTVNNQVLIPILRGSLLFLGHQRIWYVPNGFEPVESINYRIAENTYYDRLKQHRKVVLTIGRLDPIKNHEMLLYVAADILAKNNEVEFWLIGGGPLRERHEKWINERNLQDRIKLLGYRNDIDVALYRADIVVQCSYSEGSPNVLVEAMRAGKPLISTESTNLEDIISSGKNGFITPVNDKEALKSALIQMLSLKHEKLQEMGNISREMFKINFLIENSVKKLQRVYIEALNMCKYTRPELKKYLNTLDM